MSDQRLAGKRYTMRLLKRLERFIILTIIMLFIGNYSVKKSNVLRIVVLFNIIVFLLWTITGETVHATNSQELKILWKEYGDYPIPYGDDKLNRFSYYEIIDILNPPAEVLDSFTVNELAELVLKYPLMNEMLGIADSDMPIYFSSLEGNSTIFQELLWREGGIEALLEIYNSLSLDVEGLNHYDNIVVAFTEVPSFREEIFVHLFCSYISN
ncbi:MAG: hypothetical protein K5678_09450 [Acetatifactor sp.]|nr:hypothetical protein [Acetatifactor sp.]